jgi:hypothetical protein
LDELLKEVQNRLTEIVKTRDRLEGLLDAVMAVGAGLELDSMLRRIVQAAVDLVDARYGTLVVFGSHEGLSEFVYIGISSEERARMGHLPEGRGLLGLLIQHPQVIRLPLHDRETQCRRVHRRSRGGAACTVTAAGVAVENARLFEQARMRQRWLEASSAIRAELLAGASTEDALRLVAQRALELSAADGVLILLADGDAPDMLTVRTGAGRESSL